MNDQAAEQQLESILALSDQLEALRRGAASPAVAAALRGALIQLHLAARFLGDDRLAADFELEVPQSAEEVTP